MADNLEKERLITKLIEDDILLMKENLERNDVYWIGMILRDGFVGYKNKTLQRLRQEAKERNLINDIGETNYE